MKSLFVTAPLILCSSAFAHHGQDFLVTLDTATPHQGHVFSTSGFDYSKSGSEEELSFLQAFTVGLPGNLTLGATYRLADDGSGQWAGQSITPTLQWNFASWEGERKNSLSLGVALGWEIPTQGHGSGHSHADSLPLSNCSALLGIPALYQACKTANAGRASHTHGNAHSHEGIHRHGESHGFVRLLAEVNLGHHDKIAANLIAVFPDGDDPATGYALAYRHRFTEWFSAGFEATGDFDFEGEHLLYCTTTFYPSEALSFTVGLATGLTSQSSDFSAQTLATWRF